MIILYVFFKFLLDKFSDKFDKYIKNYLTYIRNSDTPVMLAENIILCILVITS
jgi:hypothetical protein